MKFPLLAFALAGVFARASYGQVDTVDMNFAFSSKFNVRDVDESNFQGSFFYLNDSVNADGNLLAGQIGWGAWEIDRNGNVVNTMRTNQTLSKNNDPTNLGIPPIGAKSVVEFGNFNFIGVNNEAGIARFNLRGPNAWDTASLTPLKTGGDLGFSVESIAMAPRRTGQGGTPPLLFTNESDPTDNRGTIHAFEVNNMGGNFELDPFWSTDVTTISNPSVNIDPRFNGVAYGGNDFVYAVDTGNGGVGSVWAFDVTDGTATKVTDYVDPKDPDGMGSTGTELSFLGEPFQGFGAIVNQDELFVVGTGGVISVFELTSPITVGDRTDFDIGPALFAAGAAESTDVALFGIAIDGDGPGGAEDFLWLSYESADERPNRRVAGFVLVNPEPGTLGLLLGALCLVGASGRRRAGPA